MSESQTAEAVGRQPNLLFVFADQMRGMDMCCAGNAQVHTPHLDEMARQGLRVTNAIATVPVCGPNRAVLLTGQFATQTQVPANDLPLSSAARTFGQTATAAGYHTGYIGKWHLDGVPRDKFTPPGPRRFGWNYWAAYNCAHDYFRPRYYRDEPQVVETAGYEPTVQTDLAIDFLRRQAAQRDQPFCLVVSWGPPHDPYAQVPQEFRRRYSPESLKLRPNVQPDAKNPLAAGLECRSTLANYYAAITALDREMGRLLAALDELALAADTLVIFTSDHGDMLWSHGWMKKQSPYEESINVPWIARWPGQIQPGSVSDALLSTVDIAPTLAGMLGWPTEPQWSGRDLSATLLGKAGLEAAPESVFISNPGSHDEALMQKMPEWRGVRTRRYTYTETLGRQPWLLLDNQVDPFQMNNLANHPAYGQVQTQLRDELTQWLVKAGDSFIPGSQFLQRCGLMDLWQQRQKSLYGPQGPQFSMSEVDVPKREPSHRDGN